MHVYRLFSLFPLHRLPVVLALALAAVLGSSSLYAVTLGEEHVLSSLGDPIEVEIDVLQWEDIDFSRVQIAVASAAEYETFDLTYLPVLQQLNFNLIGPDSAGEVNVLVSTREPVVEPYLELLLVLRWPGGSLLREYVLLFDLPETAPVVRQTVTQAVTGTQTEIIVRQPNEPVQAAEPRETFTVVQEQDLPAVSASTLTQAEPSTRATEIATTEIAATIPDPLLPAAEDVNATLAEEPVSELPTQAGLAQSEADPAPARSQTAIEVETVVAETTVTTTRSSSQTPATGRQVYQVHSGDILWNIGQQFLPAGSADNIYQMLLSLHDINRAAFINGNISLLKANALLQIPSQADINSIDATTAQNIFEQRWDEGTQRLAMARSGQQLPEFSALYTDTVDASADLAEPQDSRAGTGEELGARAAQSNGLILPDTTAVVVPLSTDVNAGDVLVGDPGAQAAANSAGVQIGGGVVGTVTGTSTGTTGSSSATLTTTQSITTNSTGTYNPYLDRINDSARELQTLLQARSMQVAQLEQQVVEMRIRMREAQEVAASLNISLERALVLRSQRATAYSRTTAMLGSFALVLLLALVLAIVMILKLTGQLRSQRKMMDADALLAADLDLPHATVQAGNTVQTNNIGSQASRSEFTRMEPVFDIEVTELPVTETRPHARNSVDSLNDDEALQQELLDMLAPSLSPSVGTDGPDHEKS